MESTKYLTAGTNYNMRYAILVNDFLFLILFLFRVLECKLAAAVLAKSIGLQWQSVKRLADVEKLSKKPLDILLEEVRTHIHPGVYTKEEVAGFIGMQVRFSDPFQFIRLL